MACRLIGAKPLSETCMLLFFIRNLGTHLVVFFTVQWINIFSFKMNLKMASAKCRPFCLGNAVLYPQHPGSRQNLITFQTNHTVDEDTTSTSVVPNMAYEQSGTDLRTNSNRGPHSHKNISLPPSPLTNSEKKHLKCKVKTILSLQFHESNKTPGNKIRNQGRS